MGRYRRLLYPVLFAASLVLGIAARGAGQFRWSDLALLIAAAAIVTAITLLLVILVTRAVVRSDRADPLAAALTMIAVAWFFYYVPAQTAAELVTYRFSRDRVLIPVGVVATIGMVVVLIRLSRERLVALGALMSRFGVLLIALVVVQAVLSHRGTPSAARRSALVRELSVPLRVSGAPPAARNSPKRDIYLIVLDGHPNRRVAREVMGFDNAWFEDSLRALGFVIPREMRSNYAHTILSMPSLLNAAHVTQLARDAGVDSRSHALPKYLLQYNRSARFLKSQGYKYVLFPSAWWSASQHSPIADVEFDARPEINLYNEARRTELRQVVLGSTLLRYWLGSGFDTRFDLLSLEGIRRLPADSAPTFLLAHVLLPHIPYYLDASCRVVQPIIVPAMEDTSAAQRAAQRAQMQCVDQRVLGVVTTLLRESRPAPVILIVGDHGSRFADPKFSEHPERATPELIRERFGAFGAFHAPAGGDSLFAGSVSLVNVMGHVLRYYFNVELPPSPDEMYMSGSYPFRYYPVDSSGQLAR